MSAYSASKAAVRNLEGKLNEGGALVHARGGTWGQLIFQDLFKKEQ